MLLGQIALKDLRQVVNKATGLDGSNSNLAFPEPTEKLFRDPGVCHDGVHGRDGCKAPASHDARICCYRQPQSCAVLD